MPEMTIKQRVAYLQGLAEGMHLDTNASEGRLLHEVISLLGEMSEALYDLRDAHEELETYVEDMDEDLSGVELDLYGEDEEQEDPELEAEPIEIFEVRCPNCGTVLHVENSGDDDDALDLICPNCGEMIYATDEEYEYDDDEDVQSDEVRREP